MKKYKIIGEKYPKENGTFGYSLKLILNDKDENHFFQLREKSLNFISNDIFETFKIWLELDSNANQFSEFFDIEFYSVNDDKFMDIFITSRVSFTHKLTDPNMLLIDSLISKGIIESIEWKKKNTIYDMDF